MTPAPGTTTSPGSAPADLLAELRDRGVAVRVEAGDLVLDAPAGSITPALVDLLKAHKVDLLAALNAHGIAPGDLPMLDDFRAVFPSAEVIEVVEVGDDDNPLPPAEQAQAIIQAARERGDEGHAQDLRDVWDERLAACTIDGGLSEDDAEVVALGELREAA